MRARGGNQNRQASGRGIATRERQPKRGNARRPLSNWRVVDAGVGADNNKLLENFQFNEIEGLNVRMPQNATCLDYLQLDLTDEILTLIVSETNRFAEQFFEKTQSTSYTNLWEPVELAEIKIFLGLVMLMGIIHKPSLPMYWSKEELLSTPIFSKVMRRDRFNLILKFLHYNSNGDDSYDENDDDRDRIHKLRLFINALRKRFQNVYSPG